MTPEQKRAKQRAYYKLNRERILSYRAQWLKDNPSKTTEYNTRRKNKLLKVAVLTVDQARQLQQDHANNNA